MAKAIGYEDISLRKVENGWQLNYCEKLTNGSSMSNTWSSYKTKVYKEGEEMSAITDMKAMSMNKYEEPEESFEIAKGRM